MKRRRGEEDLSKFLQFLDDEVAGPSDNGDLDWEPNLEPKHQIFLSHSGAQKDFTEQLFYDLERWSYSAFFDKSPDSLAKGKRFPPLIFQAARQCPVAVFILSEEFFTRSKWPMLELEAFVETQKENPERVWILPVYLGLSRKECVERRAEWICKWRRWAEEEQDEKRKIDVGKWEEALKVLGPSNGIEYVQSSGEYALRGQIVSAVRRLVRQKQRWSDENVKGRNKMCEAVLDKYAKTKPSQWVNGVRVVGVYGMGGMGKTTLCQALCDALNGKFEGRVCHAELGKKSVMELREDVLRDLTDINHEKLRTSTENETSNLLREQIRRQKVFFALDNVWVESVEEAKVYLRVGFHPGSIVLVTARSIELLTRLNIDESDCLEVPELEEEDARQLFLHHAAPNLRVVSDSDVKKIVLCVKQCQFRKGEGKGLHFHPLALKVLGGQLGSLGCDPSMWVESLLKFDKFNPDRVPDGQHPIFGILRRGYDVLNKKDQVLFMDAVLFRPGGGYVISFGLCVYEWLSAVHNEDVGSIMHRLESLKAKSLLEGVGDSWRGVGDSVRGVSVHDLYVEFAHLEAERGDLDDRRWVWYEGEGAYLPDLTRRPSGSCWQKVDRFVIRFFDILEKNVAWLDETKWQHFSNIEVLEVQIGNIAALDLRGMLSLRSLNICWGSLDYEVSGAITGLGELRSLKWLRLENIPHGPCFGWIGCLTNLKVLHLQSGPCSFKCCNEPLELPGVEKCIHLRDLYLGCLCLKAFPDLGRMTSLRKVVFDDCRKAREVRGLSSGLSALQELRLTGCNSLRSCPGLGDVVSMQTLIVEYCSIFSGLPGLHKLTELRRLKIEDTKVNEVRGFSSSMVLQDLRVSGVDFLPDLHMLMGLQRLVIKSMGDKMLRLGAFSALESLVLRVLPEMLELPDMSSMVRLRNLDIGDAPQLTQLPQLDGLMALEELHLDKLPALREIPGLHKLSSLQSLKVRDARKLTHLGPLGGLVALKIVELVRLEALEELDLSCSLELRGVLGKHGLTRLKILTIGPAPNLSELPQLGDLIALEKVTLEGLRKVRELPDMHELKWLRKLSVSHAPHLLQRPRLVDLLPLPYVYKWRYTACKMEGHSSVVVFCLDEPSRARELLDLRECHQLPDEFIWQDNHFGNRGF